MQINSRALPARIEASVASVGVDHSRFFVQCGFEPRG